MYTQGKCIWDEIVDAVLVRADILSEYIKGKIKKHISHHSYNQYFVCYNWQLYIKHTWSLITIIYSPSSYKYSNSSKQILRFYLRRILWNKRYLLFNECFMKTLYTWLTRVSVYTRSKYLSNTQTYPLEHQNECATWEFLSADKRWHMHGTTYSMSFGMNLSWLHYNCYIQQFEIV